MPSNVSFDAPDIARHLAHTRYCLAYPQNIWQPIAEQLADSPSLLCQVLTRLETEGFLLRDHVAYRLDDNRRDEVLTRPSLATCITLRAANDDPLHLNLSLDSDQFLLSPLLTRSTSTT
jgi:hypothetical protein